MRFRLAFLGGVMAALTVGASPGGAQTVDVSAADQVEEDWQIVVAAPDPDSTGPQMTTCFRAAPGSSAFIAFCLNYRDVSTWSPGGLQVKGYGESGDTPQSQPLLASCTSGTAVLQTAGETISWTQQIRVSGGTINYSVRNGTSTTWGNFGQGIGTLAVACPTSVANLGSYSPDDSVKLSAAGWQSNRVTSMALVQVRYYQGGVLLKTDTAPRNVALASSTTGATP